MTTRRILPSCLALSLLLLAATATRIDKAVSYAGYRVVRILPDSKVALMAVQAVLKDPSHAAVDVWLEPSLPGSPVDVNVPPQLYPTFLHALKSRTLSHSIMVDDVQALIDLENEGIQEARRQLESSAASSIVGSYVSYADMVTWLENLAKTNSKVTIESYGKSVENRDLTLVKISKSTGRKKPIVFIEAGMHAREWIGPATAIWMINQLATSAAADDVSLLNAADWYIVPVANPDGYEYTRSTDRLWRNNRAVNKNSACRGVDLNRNWDSHWMLVGASDDPCVELFAGPKSFSEPETQALSRAILAAKTNVKAYFSFHSYSQLWLTPWAYTTSPPPDNALLMDVATKAANALKAVNGTVYKVGSPATILYAAAGGSYDWAKETAGIKFSYTLEMRDTGRYGFVLPANQIVPTSTETWAGIKTAVKLILNV